MGRHYSTRDFFRQMPNQLLARHFAARGVLLPPYDTAATLARLARLTRLVNPDAGPLDDVLRDKHHERKHGPNAYYGQR